MKATKVSRPIVAMAGGGTGGHLYPLFAIAEQIERKAPTARFMFFATQRPLDEQLISQEMMDREYALYHQPVQPIPGAIRDLTGFIAAWRKSGRVCRRELERCRPDVLIASGGFGSGPPVCTARRKGIPILLLNPDIVPGKANRFLAPRADCVALQWEASKRFFGSRVPVEVLGCPVRSSFCDATRAEGTTRFGLDPRKNTLLITGASQGAQSINQTIIALIDTLEEIDGWQILHLTGRTNAAAVRAEYQSRSASAIVVDYTEFMASALAAADLVIARAGASTLAEITALGLPSVLMPYPYHRDDHQTLNARVLADAGAAVIVPDLNCADANASALLEVLKPLMANRQALLLMKERSAALGKPRAATLIAERALTMAGGVRHAAA